MDTAGSFRRSKIKKMEAEKKTKKKTVAKKATRKSKTTKKRELPQALNHARKIEVPDEAAIIILMPDGKLEVVPSASHTDSGVYVPHEELCIAIAALMQSEAFVETVLKTFRDLYEKAIAQSNKPIDGID